MPIRTVMSVRSGGAIVVAALLAGLLAGCGPDGGKGPSGSPSPSGSAGPGVPASPSPSTGSGTAGPSGGPGSTGTTPALETHRGTVERGVEPACLILRASDGTYELIGGDRTVLKEDAQVVVQGYRERGMMSHCMQGTMLRVVSAQLAK